SEHNEAEIVADRIDRQLLQLARLDQELKIIESHEGTSEQSAVARVLGEREINADHRRIRINQEEYDGGDSHQEQNFILLQFLEDALLLLACELAGDRCDCRSLLHANALAICCCFQFSL